MYLVTARNFVAAYEAQYREAVPGKVKRALALFIGEASDSKALLEATPSKAKEKQTRAMGKFSPPAPRKSSPRDKERMGSNEKTTMRALELAFIGRSLWKRGQMSS